jgi:hypothetical protein
MQLPSFRFFTPTPAVLEQHHPAQQHSVLPIQQNEAEFIVSASRGISCRCHTDVCPLV